MEYLKILGKKIFMDYLPGHSCAGKSEFGVIEEIFPIGSDSKEFNVKIMWENNKATRFKVTDDFVNNFTNTSARAWFGNVRGLE